MKAVILAGGYGTRISEYSDTIPKPMLTIAGEPVLIHIMRMYASYGVKEFVILCGYKQEIIKEYFSNFAIKNKDFTINTKTGSIDVINSTDIDWTITVIDTGLDTQTGGRLSRIKEILNGESFFMTYGDGLSNVNIKELLKFHKKSGKIATLTAVRPNARFGELQFDGENINKFEEKPQLNQGWINGGFFVLEPEVFNYINGDVMFERDPLSELAMRGELVGYKHDGFWQCMDTKRDRDLLENLAKGQNVPWVV